MKKSLDWHYTPWGRTILFLGSIQLAVPVLFLVAIALGVGTWLDSKQNATVAREWVYGSWWFVALMVLTCVSLIFAVITRVPLKKRHIGFVTVHASLVALIAGGFWSMWARVDGHLMLSEGTQGSIIETQEHQIEVMEPNRGDFNSLGAVPAPLGRKSLTLGGVPFEVVERWQNSKEEEVVANDSPVPLRAVDISPFAGPQSAWVGQEDQTGPAPTLAGLKVLVLPNGSDWTPPKPEGNAKGDFVFTDAGHIHALGNVGDEALPGWKITELKRFARAMVSGDTIVEGSASSPENSAVQVLLSDGKGSTELHIAFAQFPDMVMTRTIEGQAKSGAKLMVGGTNTELLVVFGTVEKTKIGYVGIDGVGHTVDVESRYPMTIKVGDREVTIHKQLSNAHVFTRVVEAPVAKDNAPAILVRVGTSTELQTVAWKNMVPVMGENGRQLALYYGPKRAQLPFTVRLDKFHKVDYPGTEMAMEYQSDVGIIFPGQPETKFNIYMNHPFAHGPWKVYQSGFNGTTVSIFSVMHDPGLTLTYIASTFLCIGVVVTFYSRSMSWGHPGIPIRPQDPVKKESKDVSSTVVRRAVVSGAAPEPLESSRG
ncbi:MAG: cytochrome c biogenesis protein ResB [Phycisphaerales bacterium]